MDSCIQDLNPTLQEQLAAVRQDPKSIRWIQNPCLFVRLMGDFSD